MKNLICAFALICALATFAFADPPPPPTCRDGEIPIWRTNQWVCEPLRSQNPTGEVPETDDKAFIKGSVASFLYWLNILT